MIFFGPVPSRRLGRSIGVNNIPPKYCTYSCIYCQLGQTNKKQIERRIFYGKKDFFEKNKIEKTIRIGESIDYLTFVPDGEPTLDINLGHEITSLRKYGIKIAVITNSSLIWRSDVKKDLMKTDLVSLKVDTTEKEIWQKINRPHQNLKLESILDGIIEFKKMYKGEIITETMLVDGINDGHNDVQEVANFIAQIKPDKTYLSIPIRPPTEKGVSSPNAKIINRSYQIFRDKIDHVECLFDYEGDDFTFSGNFEKDLLNIIAVHPMREKAVRKFLGKANKDWSFIQKMISQGLIIETEYEGIKFYTKKF